NASQKWTSIFTYNINMVAPSVFSPPLSKPVPRRTIRAVAEHIAERFQPEEIILFGSYAYGNPQPSSDVDLLVAMETPEGELKTSLEILRSLPRITFSIDILARSRSAIKKRMKMGDRFMKEITEKGKVLYARNH
ncbi:MAG: nucleotidyltransferase domain-containing protein, partial [Chloroflexota bacterium]